MDQYLCVLQQNSESKFYVQEKCTGNTKCIFPRQIILTLDDVLEDETDLLYPTEILVNQTFKIDRAKKNAAVEEARLNRERMAKVAPLEKELSSLVHWFDSTYDRITIEHGRCQRLGIECEHDIASLDIEAEQKKARINELKNMIREA